MSSRDYFRIDEVYHNMYKNKFHREEPYNEALAYDQDDQYKATAKKHMPEAAKAIMHKLKLEHPDNFDEGKARAAVKHALGAISEEDCEGWMQDYSHTPDQKRAMAEYIDSEDGEEKHCKWAEEGCKCGECEECQ